MNFIKYCCYYLFIYFQKKGKAFENSVVAAVLYVSLALFFYFLTLMLFLRFLDVKLPDLRILMLIMAVTIYLILYYKVEKTERFLEILNDFEVNKKKKYKGIWVILFIFGSITFFILSLTALLI